MVKIVSDSTCDLSPELLKRYNISILPLHVYLGDQEYLDGVNISPDTLYAWSNENKSTPKTSAPSIDDAITLFRAIMKPEDEIIAFSISSSMSASYKVMNLAAEELDAADRVYIIDSQSLSTGIGLLVLAAAEMAELGLGAQEIANAVQMLVPKVRASFVVDTLTYLHRGGRCSSVAALAGSALKLHPRIAVGDGAMSAKKKYRGKYSAIVLNYVKDMEEELRNAKTDHVFITHSGIDETTLSSVVDYLKALDYFKQIHITRAGSVVSSHCGPGTLGVLFISN